LCSCRLVKGKSAAQIIDEHGLDDEMSKPGSKTRQGDRLARTENWGCRGIRLRKHWQPAHKYKFGSAGIGSLQADANSTARNGLCKSLVRLGTI